MEATVNPVGQSVETRLSLLEDYRVRAEQDVKDIKGKIDRLILSCAGVAILLLLEIVLNASGVLHK